MNNNLALEAFVLFVETMDMDKLDVNDPVEFKLFEELYEKECQIFELFGRMTDDDKAAYRKAVQHVSLYQTK